MDHIDYKDLATICEQVTALQTAFDHLPEYLSELTLDVADKLDKLAETVFLLDERVVVGTLVDRSTRYQTD